MAAESSRSGRGSNAMTKAYALAADQNGRIPEAAAAYEAALIMNPADLEATLNLVVLYWQIFELAECRQLLREHPDYLEPAFVVFSDSEGMEAEPEAMRLLADYSEQPTVRARYVTAVINGTLRRQRFCRQMTVN
jgi:hypothetical protein